MASIQKLARTKTDSKTGKRTQKVSYRVFIRLPGLRTITKSFSTKKLAEAFARRIEGDHETAEAFGGKTSVIMRSMTLGKLIDHYSSKYSGRDLSQASRLTWWKDHYGKHKLIAVDRDLILDALHKLSTAYGRRAYGRGRNVRTRNTNKPRSPATINRYKATLASVFKFGMNDKELRLPTNPCRGIPSEPESKGRIRFLSAQERKDLLAACKESSWPRLHLLVSMAITTGARKSELLRLTWESIDFKARRAFISTSKNGDPRVLPLTTNPTGCAFKSD
jgi:site-specific recombinase XerD